MLAPCGINCMLCYAHLTRKKKCPGCLCGDENKSSGCLNCKIKTCAEERGYTYCFECGEFPCKRVKDIDKRYRLKYHTNPIENLLYAREKGVEAFLKMDAKRWKCGECGGIIGMHSGECSECGFILYEKD
jgi:hypothetical protein